MLSLEEHVALSLQLPAWPEHQRPDLVRVVDVVTQNPHGHETHLVARLHQDLFAVEELTGMLLVNPAFLKVVCASFQEGCLQVAENLEEGRGAWTFAGFLNHCRKAYWLHLVLAVLQYQATQGTTEVSPFPTCHVED